MDISRGGIGGGRKFFGNSRGVGGSYVKFPPWWGYGYFLELHIRGLLVDPIPNSPN